MRGVDDRRTRHARGGAPGPPVIFSVVRHGHVYVVGVDSRRQERRTKTGRWRDLVPGTKALPMCVASETASGTLHFRDSENESGKGCQ